MRQILHILTQPNDPLAAKIIAAQRQEPDHQVRVADLTVPEADYHALLQEIFSSDSIEVW
ncbi:MAG: hypothetical protein EXS31_17920 [Pedosphaera sp.]|nr:hypothetical protein [Pedosphaera sp.]